MVWYKIILILVISYLIGSFQSSYIFGKLIKKTDIRNYGSGNPGATNAIRVFGLKFGLVVLLIDALKGAVAVMMVKYGFGSTSVALQLLAGMFCILGHNYPFYMGFKGGKGVAASLGIILMVDWRVFLIAGIPALIVMVITRIMSVASLTFEFASLIAFFAFYLASGEFALIVLTAALYPLMSFYRHRKNIINLLEGKESRLWGKGVAHIDIEKENERKPKDD